MENLYQKFAKDIIVIGITNLVVGLSGLALLPLLTKTLGAHDYGIWSQVNVTIGLVMPFAGLGLSYAMVRFMAAKTSREEIQEEFYSVFSLVLLSTLIISSLLVILAGFLANTFFDGATQIVRITGLIILVWSLDSVCLGLFRAFRQMKRYSIFIIAEALGRVGLIACLVANGYGLFGVVLSVLIVRTVILFILCYMTKSQIGVKRPHFSKIREYLNFGLPTIPASITGWVVASSDRYVIGYFLGAAAVGVYAAGYTLGNIPFMLSALLSFVLLPTVSKLYDEGRMNEVKTHLTYSLKYFLALAIPFVFGGALLGKQVLSMFSTPEIATQGYFIVPLVALGTLFLGVYGVIAHILIMVKKTRIIGATWGISALVNLLLNILIVPHIGFLGAAITTLIAYLLALGIVTYYSFKEFRFSIEWRFIIKSLIASTIMSAVIWLIAPQSTLAVVVTITAGVIVYGLTLLLLKGFKREEIKFFRGLFQRGAAEINSDDRKK